MGSFLGNLLSKKDFLFVRGGPYFLYLFYHLLARPILGAFVALLVHVAILSGVFIQIGSVDPDTGASVLIVANAHSIGYVYALIAVVSGFAAERVARNLIDRVLRRLEREAEKSTPSTSEGTEGDEASGE